MPRDARTVAKYVVAGLALAAMLALAPFFLASGLMAPGWAVGIFIAVWLLLFGLGCFWIRRKPLWVIPLPLIAVVFWYGGMNAGESGSAGRPKRPSRRRSSCWGNRPMRSRPAVGKLAIGVQAAVADHLGRATHPV